MIILAIDPGSHLGWALARDGKLIESGVEDFGLKRGESPGSRYLRFRKWLQGQAIYTGGDPDNHGWPNLVAYEQPHHRGGHATEVLVGMTTRLQEFAAEIGAECVAVHSATLKKHATGSGRASKLEMIHAADNRWKPKPGLFNDNEADALLILAWAIEEYGA